ncbi:MAG: AAA family ATPase [Deltaproteobacteria bacterium]|nr:AAA family ATPase [Deltaproteobacteria bacterium]
MAFLDEIFKSNSAILNTLLTIVNERKFPGRRAPPVALRMLFAATNDIPEQSEPRRAGRPVHREGRDAPGEG